MIDEKEIRIGNWFHYDPIQWNYAAHSGDFKWSSSDWFALGESTLFLEDIEPVPLTGVVIHKSDGYVEVKWSNGKTWGMHESHIENV